MSDTNAAPNSAPVESATGTLDQVTQAARQGAADASEAAVRSCAAIKRFTARFVYTTCYTISYGVVFPSILLAQAVPRNNTAVQGLIVGAHAARKRVDALSRPALEPASDSPVAALSPA